jgi:hypothetical protein
MVENVTILIIFIEVILLISTSNKFSHLYIRNGKIVAAASVSIKFVVNQTGYGVQTVQ